MRNFHDKKNILQILPAMNEGGVERGVYDLCLYAKEVSSEFQVIVASNGGKYADILKGNNLIHEQLNLKTKNPIKIFCNVFKIINLCKKHNISLIHARSRAPAWSAFFAAKILKIKFLTTFHGFYKRTGLFKNYYNSIMVKGQGVIAVSEFIKHHILKYYKITEDKITVIHRGVDLKFFNPENISASDILNFKTENNLLNKKVIVIAGRITRWKGQDVAIQALKNISNSVLLIVGSVTKASDYYDELKAMANANNLENRVIFFGSSNNLPLIYSAADVILNCSREAETFGRVTAEALAMQKPVIATNIGGSKEIIIDNESGFLVEPNNPAKLSEKINYIFANMEEAEFLKNLKEKSRVRVKEHFSLEQMCKKEFEVYRKLLESN